MTDVIAKRAKGQQDKPAEKYVLLTAELWGDCRRTLGRLSGLPEDVVRQFFILDLNDVTWAELSGWGPVGSLEDSLEWVLASCGCLPFHALLKRRRASPALQDPATPALVE